MAEGKDVNVTMRVRIADAELEVTGPKDFVEEKIAAFVKAQRDTRSPHQGNNQTSSLLMGGLVDQSSPPKGLSAAQFFKKAPSKSDVDRVLAAGYFLEKHNGADNFTTAEIVQTIRQAKITPPSNPSDSVAQNIKKGLMMSAGDKDGKKAFVLTSDGEEAVYAAMNQAQ